MADSSQKFIARNRAPRVQIEYDVELYGAEKKVQLPFVMGVMADLTGQSKVAQPAIADRKFLEIDADNFDDRMRSIAPRAAFSVPNTLTGEGNLSVDLTFESMSDFSPGAIASKVDALRPLLEARQQLEQLMTYMDGKAGAEELIEKILGSPALLSSLVASGPSADAETNAALQSLREVDVPPEDTGPEAADILGQLASQAPAPPQDADSTAEILGDLSAAAPQSKAPADDAAEVLSALASAAPAVVSDQEDETADTLAQLAASTPVADIEEDETGSVLSALGASEPAVETPDHAVENALADLAAQTPAEEADAGDSASSVLSTLTPATADDAEGERDIQGDILANIDRSEGEEEGAAQEVEDALASLDTAEDDTPSDQVDIAGVLSGVQAVEEATEEVDEDLSSLLGDLDTPQDAETVDVDHVLSALETVDDRVAEDDVDLDALLGGLDTPTEMAEESADDVLSDLAAVEEARAEEDVDLDALLGGLDTPADVVEESADDVLSDLAAVEEATSEEDVDLDALLGGLDAPTEMAEESADDVLSGLAAVEEATSEEDVDLDALLGGLDAPTEMAEESADDVLSGLAAVEEATAEGDLDLDALLGDLDASEAHSEPTISEAAADLAEVATSAPEEDLDLDTLLGDVETGGGESGLDFEGPSDDGDFDLDSLLAETGEEDTDQQDTDSAVDLDELLGEDSEADHAEADQVAGAGPAGPDEADDDLDDLLGGLDLEEAETGGLDDLDALFDDLDAEVDTEEADDLSDLDALLADLGDDDSSDDADLDDLLGDLDDAGAEEAPSADGEKSLREPELAYGTISADRPEPQKLTRKRFRIAIFGDFTGRAAKGQIDTGAALAERKPVILDPDTIDDVIESFATELVLPIGKDGAGISVKLGEIDDLHPDELYDNVELFSELVSLRKQLQSGVTKDHAMKTLSGWAEAHGTPAHAPTSRSGGNAVPADKRLSEFQSLIGDTTNSLRTVSPVEDMLARIVGPHIRALPDPNLGAMQAAVDLALSDAMRLVLHHPEFQSVEAQWRSLDLIARSVEVDDTLEVMIHDVSAEELAADLAAQEDLSQTGFVRLLTEEPMDEDNGRGAYSALVGLYTFEETPPHAELLARFARVAAHVDAPFLAAISPGFWGTEKAERPKVVAQAWDTLSGMSEAGHLGLLTPRFLLRRPYGARSEPIDPFDFEEFTQAEGLRGMLWGNPVVLAAILMAKSFKENGPSLQLGSIMSLGDMPFHYVNDRFGDQVALPCTERNVDLEKIAFAKERGFMPIASVRGRDEIRLTSFNSLRGEPLLGPWTGEPAPHPSPPDPRPSKPAAAASEESGDGDDFDLDLDLDDASGDDDDLDALLAGFGDDDTDLDGDLDADLEALLNDL